MLPKFHLITGFVFCFICYYFLNFPLFGVLLIFLANLLIDFDHYIFHIFRYNNFNLKYAYEWHKKLPKKHKSVFHIFHSLEFLMILYLLALFNINFLYLLTGILFHSIFDLIQILYQENYCGRELSLINYIIKDKQYYL